MHDLILFTFDFILTVCAVMFFFFSYFGSRNVSVRVGLINFKNCWALLGFNSTEFKVKFFVDFCSFIFYQNNSVFFSLHTVQAAVVVLSTD